MTKDGRGGDLFALRFPNSPLILPINFSRTSAACAPVWVPARPPPRKGRLTPLRPCAACVLLAGGIRVAQAALVLDNQHWELP
jgi:hypothetical protein